MKRIAIFGILLLALVALGGLSAAWWWQANLLQTQAEAPSPHPLLSIAKQAVTKTGYPFHPGVRVDHPSFTLSNGAMALGLGFDALTLEKSLFSSQYRLLYGKTGSLSFTAPARKWEINFENEAPSILSFVFDAPWNFLTSSEANQPKAWLDRLRHLEMHATPARWTDKAGIVLITSGASDLSGTLQPVPNGPTKHEWHFKAANMQYTAAYDALMRDILSAVFGQPQPSNLAYYGPITTELGAKFSLPQQGMTNPFQAIDIAVSPVTFTSDLGTVDMHFTLQQQAAQSGALEGKTSFELSSTTTPKADQIVAQNLLHMLRDPHIADTFPASKNLSDAQLWPVIGAMTPRSASLGTMHEALDASYHLEMASRNHRVELTRFALEATPYGVTAKGNGALKPGAPPMVDATIDCRNCDLLFRDLTAYLDRLKQSMMQLGAQSPADPLLKLLIEHPVSETIRSAATQLKPLANVIGGANVTAGANATDGGTEWEFHLQQSATAPLTINNHPLEAFLPIAATLTQLRPTPVQP